MNNVVADPNVPRGQLKQGWLPCRFFALGTCRNGAACPYSHENTGQIQTNNPAKATTGEDTRSRVACRFFLQGRCTKGHKCPFKHDNAATVVAKKPNIEPTDEDKPWKGVECSREMAGALVLFGDGAQVKKVSLPSDFSAAHISGLPRNTDLEFVINIFANLGFPVPHSCIRVQRSPDGSYSADIRVEDEAFTTKVYEPIRTHHNYRYYDYVPI